MTPSFIPYEYAATVLLILAGLAVAYAAISRIVRLFLTSYEEETGYLHLWRTLSGTVYALAGLAALLGSFLMHTSPVVREFCLAHELNPVMVMFGLVAACILFALMDAHLMLKRYFFFQRLEESRTRWPTHPIRA